MRIEEERTDELFRRLPSDPRARQELIEAFLPLAKHVARRYGRRGQELEDLEQVACVGLIKAIDRYDVERDAKFVSFAAPTITGEIKRHFRDKGWSLGVSRTLKDLSVRIRRATEELTQSLGRSPSTVELARFLDCDEEQVLEVAALGTAYRPESIDLGYDDDSETTLSERLGETDPALSLFENLEALGPALARLPEREKEILRLRFVEDLTQREIADRIGYSQMHISRLLSQSFETLRRDLLPELH